MERTGADEQNVIRFDRTVLGIDDTALDNRKDISLYPFAGYARAASVLAVIRDFIHFVDEDNAILFRIVHCIGGNLIHIEKFLRFLITQNFSGILHFDSSFFGARRHGISENAADADAHIFIAADVDHI